MTLEVVQSVVSAAVVLVFAAFALVTAGGIAAFFAILRANKRALELAYLALPPEAAALIRQIALALKDVGDLADEVTDGALE
jgi:Na+/proline symporter